MKNTAIETKRSTPIFQSAKWSQICVGNSTNFSNEKKSKFFGIQTTKNPVMQNHWTLLRYVPEAIQFVFKWRHSHKEPTRLLKNSFYGLLIKPKNLFGSGKSCITKAWDKKQFELSKQPLKGLLNSRCTHNIILKNSSLSAVYCTVVQYVTYISENENFMN